MPEGYVYFLAGDGQIKIGFSARPYGRKTDLERAVGADLKLIALYAGGLEDERREHQKWALDRLEGEWFRATEGLCGYAESIGVCLAETADDVAEAQVWLDYLLQRQALKKGVTKAGAINHVVKASGVGYSVLYGLKRHRLSDISSTDYAKLRVAHMREKVAELDFLQAEVARLRADFDRDQAQREGLSDIPRLYAALGLDAPDQGGA